MAEGKKGIDRNVFLALGVIVIIGLIIVGARFLMQPEEECPEAINFSVSSTSLTVNEEVTFSYTGAEGDELVWTLGDTTIETTATSFKHTYTKPGNYSVSVMVNEKCNSAVKSVAVAPDLTKRLDAELPLPVIEGPATAKVGEPVKFKEVSGSGKSWEWYFQETGGVDAVDQEPTYAFQTPGRKVITVIINGSSKRGNFEIDVKPVPPAKTAGGGGGAKKNAGVSEEQFKDMLMKLESRELDIFAFRDCMCNYLNMMITVNGERKQFDSYCSGIRLAGNQQINRVQLTKDENGCITAVAINQTKIEE